MSMMLGPEDLVDGKHLDKGEIAEPLQGGPPELLFKKVSLTPST